MDQTRIMRTGFVVAMTGLVTTVLLAACNSGGDGNGSVVGGGGGGGGQPPVVVAKDAFIAKVITVAANTPDNTDPELTDSVAATSPDTTEPVEGAV